jgi:hypothetical protein
LVSGRDVGGIGHNFLLFVSRPHHVAFCPARLRRADTRSKKVLAWKKKRTDCKKSFFDRISGEPKHTAGQAKAWGVLVLKGECW